MVGCQALSISYASTTTASGTGSSQWGDYTGLVNGISYTAYDPSTLAMKTVQVAAYAYDNTGHLRAAWDPRLSTPLKTQYDYDSSGRITKVTPPGFAAWSIHYDDAGRVADVSRYDADNSATATTAVVYGVPVTGAGAPIDMDDPTTGSASWGQNTDLPYIGTAIFDPAAVSARSLTTNSHGDYTPSSSDYPYGSLTYVDVNGRTVDSASYGDSAWQIDSTRYDANGNTVWTLDALGRARALSPDASTDPYVAAIASTADRANLLATTTSYSADGVDLISTEGPAHQVQLASGTLASARTLTTNTYDQGAPSSGLTPGCPCDLVTETTTAPDVLDGTATTSADTKYVYTGYDPIDGTSSTGNTSGWVLRAPTTVTTVMGTGSGKSSADIVTKTRYDSSGRVVETDMPASSGTDAGTTLTTYYAAGGSGPCGGHPEWADLTCQTAPAAQPSGTTIPSTLLKYDMYGNTSSSQESSGSTTRITTLTYDAIERPAVTDITVTPTADGGTAVPDITTTYDPSSGLPTSVTDGSLTISQSYNSLGEQTSYSDADSNSTTTTYDIDGRVHTENDGKGTYTYAYDGTDANGNTEHRGLLTSLDTGMGTGISAFTGGYDAGGNLTTEDYPNGLAASTSYDSTGAPRTLTYAKSGSTWLSFASTEDAYGQSVSTSSPESEQDNTYDNDGRLTQVADTNLGQCTTRAYAFGKDSTRTSLTTYAPNAADGSCQGSSGTTVTNSFDTADRITNTGYVYDKFGRATTVPNSDTANAGGNLTVGYYANDMVASQSQGTAAKTFSLDPAERIRGAIDSTSGGETRRITNHYDGTSDDPAWINTSTDGGSTWTWERNVLGLDGNLVALQDSTGTPELQLTNLHGDVVATVADATSATGTDSYFESDEYGNPRATNGVNPLRYGWLGGQERSNDDLADLVLMGARLYNPAEGVFPTGDTVANGNANPYNYPTNPIDDDDVSGHSCESLQTYHSSYGITFHRLVYTFRVNTTWCWSGGQITFLSSSYYWRRGGHEGEPNEGSGFLRFSISGSTAYVAAYTSFGVNAGSMGGASGQNMCIAQTLYAGGHWRARFWYQGYTSFSFNWNWNICGYRDSYYVK